MPVFWHLVQFVSSLFVFVVVVIQGMVEPGQVVTQALKAEFGEEAMAKLNVTDEEREKISRLIDKLFNNGVEVISEVFIFLMTKK